MIDFTLTTSSRGVARFQHVFDDADVGKTVIVSGMWIIAGSIQITNSDGDPIEQRLALSDGQVSWAVNAGAFTDASARRNVAGAEIGAGVSESASAIIRSGAMVWPTFTVDESKIIGIEFDYRNNLGLPSIERYPWFIDGQGRAKFANPTLEGTVQLV